MNEEKFRKRLSNFMGHECRIEWLGNIHRPTNMATGIFSAIIGPDILISFEGYTIKIPINKIIDIKIKVPEWEWHDLHEFLTEKEE